MSDGSWVRARSEEQVEYRVSEILDASARLYERNRFDDISLVMIAREAGFTRSNLYRYFHTKEEVFLELLNRDLMDWLAGIERYIGEVEQRPASLAKAWVDALYENRRMLRLFSLLYTTLEPKVSLEALTEFKRRLVNLLQAMGSALVAAYPSFTPDAVARFLTMQASLVIGTYPMTDLTEKQRTAMEQVGMVSAPLHYRELLEDSISFLILGLTEGDT